MLIAAIKTISADGNMELGRGSNGVVRRPRGAEYVTKQCCTATERNTVSLIREIGLLRYLGPHPQIVELLDVRTGKIVLRYGGISLRRYMGTVQDGLGNHPLLNKLCASIATALHVLHRCGIAHRDIKPENILLSGTPSAPVVRICDFGVSSRVGAAVLPQRGAPSYCAPELVATGMCANLLAADVWAAGCVFYELQYGSAALLRDVVESGGVLALQPCDASGCFDPPEIRPTSALLCAIYGIGAPETHPRMVWYVRPASAFTESAIASRRKVYSELLRGGLGVRAFCLAASICDYAAYGVQVRDMVQVPKIGRGALAGVTTAAAYIAESYLCERQSSTIAPPPISGKLLWALLESVHLEQLLICDIMGADHAACAAALLLPEIACKSSEDVYGIVQALIAV